MFGPKKENSPNFGYNNNFPQKMGHVGFMHLFNPTFIQTLKK